MPQRPASIRGVLRGAGVLRRAASAGDAAHAAADDVVGDAGEAAVGVDDATGADEPRLPSTGLDVALGALLAALALAVAIPRRRTDEP